MWLSLQKTQNPSSLKHHITFLPFYISIHKSSLYSLLHEPPAESSKMSAWLRLAERSASWPMRERLTNKSWNHKLQRIWFTVSPMDALQETGGNVPCWRDNTDWLQKEVMFVHYTWIHRLLRGAWVDGVARIWNGLHTAAILVMSISLELCFIQIV